VHNKKDFFAIKGSDSLGISPLLPRMPGLRASLTNHITHGVRNFFQMSHRMMTSSCTISGNASLMAGKNVSES
jgi:hypothetical protein